MNIHTLTWLFSFKKSLKIASPQYLSFGTLIMWTKPGLVGLVLMLLASVETKSGQEQSIPSDNGLRIEFKDTEKHQEVNIGTKYTNRFTHNIPNLKVF